VRVRVGLVVIALTPVIAACASQSSHAGTPPTSTTRPIDARAALEDAAKASLAASTASINGSTGGPDGGPVVVFSGAADVQGRRVALTFKPAPHTIVPYSPYEIRLVDGVTYLELAKGVQPPAAVPPGTRWLAYTTLPGNVPIPLEAVPPSGLLNALRWPVDQPIVSAAFINPSSSQARRILIRFADVDRATNYTYSIGSDGRIASVTALDTKSQQDTTAHYAYDGALTPITAPSVGVHRIASGEAPSS
jgi:hypothetical protein